MWQMTSHSHRVSVRKERIHITFPNSYITASTTAPLLSTDPALAHQTEAKNKASEKKSDEKRSARDKVTRE